MDIPPAADPCWSKALIGPEPKISSLATRLVVTRLRQAVAGDPAALRSKAAELHAFFAKNAFAARDLASL